VASCADVQLYKLIKREMDCNRGILSQVMIMGKASGLGPQGSNIPVNRLQQYVLNVALKVNHKLGGQNLRIQGFGESPDPAPPIWNCKPTMLIGMDVSHPQSFDTNEPSIFGLVASMDRWALSALHPALSPLGRACLCSSISIAR
jgi:eukaryotic translation initiation factor 2C